MMGSCGSGASTVHGARGHVESTTVFNLEVTATSTYAVTEAGVLVHNKAAPNPRKPWLITAERTDKVATHKIWGVFSRHDSTGLWWSKDVYSHGGSVWKVFRESNRGLEWVADADKFGDFIRGKHKGPTGLYFEWKDLIIRQ